MYPEMVAGIAPICGTAKTSPHNWLFLEGVKLALQTDAAWVGGEYEEPPTQGLRAFSTVYSGWAMSQTFYREGLYRTAAGQQFDTLQRMAVLSLLSFGFGRPLSPKGRSGELLHSGESIRALESPLALCDPSLLE